MKLLVITQKVNKNDPVLGFFHEWLKRLSLKTEQLTVICLEAGEYNLPENVQVLSLGKENKKSRLVYLKNFYKYIFNYRQDYDGVFIHMNPEYAFLGGMFWKLWHKKVLLWYMHKAVNWRLWLGEKFVNKIFTGSKESFRLSSKKVEVVGHGIPTDLFKPSHGHGLVWVGRLDKIKGTPPEGVDIISNVPYYQMPEVYQKYDTLIHTSKTGSMDKVVLEAMACGLNIITESEAYKNKEFNYKNEEVPIQKNIDYVRVNHNLDNVINKIINYFSL